MPNESMCVGEKCCVIVGGGKMGMLSFQTRDEGTANRTRAW